MLCPICKNEINEDSKFCTQCGKQIPRCPTCNKVITKKVRFCIHDGTPLPEDMFAAFSSVPSLDTSTITSTIPKTIPNENKLVSTKKRRNPLPLLLLLLFLGIIVVFGYRIHNGTVNFKWIMSNNTESSDSNTESNEDNLEVDNSDILQNDSDTDSSVSNDENMDENAIPSMDENVNEDTSSESETTDTDVSQEDDSETTEVKPEAPAVSMDAISSVSATSYLTETNYGLVHHPNNLIDGTLSKAWVENVSGQGEGESITLQLNGVYKVSGFLINAGYQKSADIYKKNSRPATLLLTFSDGTAVEIELEDQNKQQQIIFPSSIETSSITFTIQSVYSGSKYEDTVISEIQLF